MHSGFVDLQSCVVALEAGMNYLFCTYWGSTTRAGEHTHTYAHSHQHADKRSNKTRTSLGGAASRKKKNKTRRPWNSEAAHRTFSKDGRTVVKKLNTFIKVFVLYFIRHRAPLWEAPWVSIAAEI